MYALFTIVCVVILISFIELGSTAAFEGIVSLSALALYASYAPAIVFLTIRKLKGEPIAYGPWHMGKRSGILVNIYAICWTLFVCCILPISSTLPVSALSMNWSGPVFGFAVLLALIFWAFAGKYFRMLDKPVDTGDEVAPAEK